jgi:hypothetical protein
LKQVLILVLKMEALGLEDDSKKSLSQLPVVSDSSVVDVHAKDGKIISIHQIKKRVTGALCFFFTCLFVNVYLLNFCLNGDFCFFQRWLVSVQKHRLHRSTLFNVEFPVPLLFKPVFQSTHQVN